MANWAIFPLTHFERWAKSIRHIMPSFFKDEDPDVEDTTKRLLSLNGDLTKGNVEGNRHDLNMETSMLLLPLLVSSGKNHRQALALKEEAIKLHDKATEIYKQMMADHPDSSVDDLVSDGRHPKFNSIMSRSKKLSLQGNYITNGGLSASEEMIDEMLMFLRDFNWCGRKIFRIEEQITQELILTDVEGVSAQFFKLPYQTICVHSPFNNVVCLNGKPIEWSYMSEYEEGDERHMYMMYVNNDGYPFFHDVLIKDEEPLGARIKNSIIEKYGKEAGKEHIAIFSMLGSMILYMNSEKCDIREVKARPSLMDKRESSRLAVCSLGGSIRVDKSLHMSNDANGQQTERTIHILKWTVRGHFRNQAHGPKMSERKIIWVRPYLKGKERDADGVAARSSSYSVTT